MENFDMNGVLDAIKERHGLKSDYKLGLYLVSRFDRGFRPLFVPAP